jgi:hypothetical protein
LKAARITSPTTTRGRESSGDRGDADDGEERSGIDVDLREQHRHA